MQPVFRPHSAIKYLKSTKMPQWQIKEYAYKGFGEDNRKSHWYSSAVRVGPFINCAGQGGQDPVTHALSDDINKQIDQAFKNVDIALQDAGGKGWSQVIKITSYHVPLDNTQQDAMVRNFKKWMPNRHPTWTCIETPRLGGGPNMRVEIQVEAYDEEYSEK